MGLTTMVTLCMMVTTEQGGTMPERQHIYAVAQDDGDHYYCHQHVPTGTTVNHEVKMGTAQDIFCQVCWEQGHYA